MSRQCQCAGCRAFTRLDSVNRQSVAMDESSIDALSTPYEYVEALRQAQGGVCGCGRCAVITERA